MLEYLKFWGCRKKNVGCRKKKPKERHKLGSFFLHPHVFLPAPPHCHAKTKLSLLIFKISKYP